MRIVIVGKVSLLLVLLASDGRGEGVQIRNPIRAFVYGEYERGNDYFINGNDNTYIFRCALTNKRDGIDGVALSEVSIWGNHGGPWEVFRRMKDGDFVYVGTRALSDTSCLETCQSNDYLTLGRCKWQRGWPKR